MSATATLNLSTIAAQWRLARRLYPIYSSINRQFGLGVEPCRDLEIPINRSEPDVLRRIAQWFDVMDDKVQVWQLRQLLQTSHSADGDSLRALLKRQLDKAQKTADVRDKVDYLLIQYYAQRAPEDAHNSEITFDQVVEVLEDVVGKVTPELPAFCGQLDGILADLSACKSLGDLLEKRIIERARDVKQKAGGEYFLSPALIAFVRFNYSVRMGFFRLMHADLHAVRHALHQMEARGQVVCDCSSAGLSKRETLAHLHQICHDWKKPFRAAYSAGNNFKQLVAIRAAVDAAVKAPVPDAQPPSPPVAAAAVAVPAQPGVKPSVIAESPSVEEYLEKIAAQLLGLPQTSASVSNLAIGQTKLLLASWEVAAFTRGGDDVSDALQRAVAARAILQIAVDSKKRGEAVDVALAIATAHAEAAQMQERIAAAKDAKNIDAAVNLAATHKRLLSLVAESEKLQGAEA
jgi:hypothetical protein